MQTGEFSNAIFGDYSSEIHIVLAKELGTELATILEGECSVVKLGEHFNSAVPVSIYFGVENNLSSVPSAQNMSTVRGGIKTAF